MWFAVAVAALTAIASPRVTGEVIKGSWQQVHGPQPLYTAHLYDVHGYAPANAITYRYKSDDPMNKVKFSPAIERDKNLFPGTCFEIDTTSGEPLSVENGRDRVGGFERIKDIIMGMNTISVRDDTITLRLGRLRNHTLPLLVTKSSPMTIRCGPLMRRDSDGSAVVKLAEIDRSAVADGRIPEGYSSYVVGNKHLADPYITFDIHGPYPLLTLQKHDGQPLASVAAGGKKKGWTGTDITEQQVRRNGFHLRVSLAYDVWGLDIADPTEALQLKALIASSFTCSPTPCHQRLRDRDHWFTSIRDYEAQLANGTAQEKFGDSLTQRIIRPDDVTLSYHTATIIIEPDELFERGFDLLPLEDPPFSNIGHGGNEIKIAETYYTLLFQPTLNLTRRSQELRHQLDHESGPNSLKYTLTAYPFAPPSPRLSEMDVARDHFVPIDHPLVITEDCIRGSNTSSSCPRRLIATLRFTRPQSLVAAYMRPPEVYERYLFREVATEATQDNDTFITCRRSAYGWPSTNGTFVSMAQFASRDRPDLLELKHRVFPAFDLDREVTLNLRFHFGMFDNQQPAESAPPLQIVIVPNPGELRVTASTSADATVDGSVLVLPTDSTLTIEIGGDVFRVSQDVPMADVLDDEFASSLLSAVLRMTTRQGPITGVVWSAGEISFTREACGGVIAVRVSKITAQLPESTTPRMALVVTITHDAVVTGLEQYTASGIAPRVGQASGEPTTIATLPGTSDISDEL
jgi:hypothetical protein